MGIEIERKFLVVGEAWREAAHAVVPMAQGYLNDLAAVEGGAQKASVRVRIQGGSAFLNLKSRQAGHSRHEYEYPIPSTDAQELLALCVGGRIEKRRHLVQVGAHLWEVDEFLGENSGLVVAEVELGSADEAFQMPAWAGLQVTDALRYYNLSLASHPYSRWNPAERAASDITQGSNACS